MNHFNEQIEIKPHMFYITHDVVPTSVDTRPHPVIPPQMPGERTFLIEWRVGAAHEHIYVRRLLDGHFIWLGDYSAGDERYKYFETLQDLLVYLQKASVTGRFHWKLDEPQHTLAMKTLPVKETR